MGQPLNKNTGRLLEQTIFTNFLFSNPSIMIFLASLGLFTFGVTILGEGFGLGLISTSFVKTLGKTLCLCIIAIAMDLVWGYCGILSLGHFAFFGLGGYMIGMWLMFARTKLIVVEAAHNAVLPPHRQKLLTLLERKYLALLEVRIFR